MKSATATYSENGRMMKPLPMNAYVSLKMTIWMAFVMSWAMPRPAIINTSVATIGWMRPYETSTPFHTPQSVATINGTMITSPQRHPACTAGC